MIELRQASKSYAGTRVLDAIDLSMTAGRTTVLIGPSGCGKSTILRLMLGLIELDSGQVILDEEPVGSGQFDRVRRRTGYVIQDGGLFPHMTARRNISLMAAEAGWPDDSIAARLSELVRLTTFPADGLDRYPAELSGGQRQRVALMRALMLDPDLLLLDEPLGALDPMIRFDLQSDLREIFSRLGKTVVLVTHDLAEAGYFGEDIVLLRDGRIVQRDCLSGMIRAPADRFVSRFVTAQRGGHLGEPEPGR